MHQSAHAEALPPHRVRARVPRHQRARPRALVLALGGVAALGACATEWDAKVVFPASYATTYQKLHDCKASAHPNAAYVTAWLSPEGKDAMATWVALPAGSSQVVAWPEGTILVKAQYKDSACKELEAYTAMKKLATGAATKAGDWRWQHVGPDGECLNCDNGTACSGCHTSPACNDLVCTRAE